MGWGGPDQMVWWIATPIAIILWGTYFYMTRTKKEKK